MNLLNSISTITDPCQSSSKICTSTTPGNYSDKKYESRPLPYWFRPTLFNLFAEQVKR